MAASKSSRLLQGPEKTPASRVLKRGSRRSNAVPKDEAEPRAPVSGRPGRSQEGDIPKLLHMLIAGSRTGRNPSSSRGRILADGRRAGQHHTEQELEKERIHPSASTFLSRLSLGKTRGRRGGNRGLRPLTWVMPSAPCPTPRLVVLMVGLSVSSTTGLTFFCRSLLTSLTTCRTQEGVGLRICFQVVALVPKDSTEEDQRPITVAALAYRAWASVFSRQPCQ